MKTGAPGFSLVTLVIALGIFSVGLLSVTTLLPVGRRSVSRVVSSTIASGIAERELARIRTRHGRAGDPPPARLAGRDPASGYRWEAQIEGEGIYTVTLVVSWEEKGEEKRKTFVTRFTPRPEKDAPFPHP